MLLDLGSGALGPLQRFIDPLTIDAVLVSHLHPDHYFDISGLYVCGSTTPTARAADPGLGPAGHRDGRPPAPTGLRQDPGMSARVRLPRVRRPADPRSARSRLTSRGSCTRSRPTASASSPTGRVLVYSGDTGPCQELVDLAAGADLLLCEAAFVEGGDNPADLHLTGADAGRRGQGRVRRLLLTHIPPWPDRDEVEADLATTWTGEHTIVRPGDVVEL